jgi:pSer/pThr/pTyr-binding forkhead associated (FHA) protein
MTTRRLVITGDGPGPFVLRVEGDTVTLAGARAGAATVLQQLRVRHVHCVLEVEGDHVTCRSDAPGAAGVPHEMRTGEALQADGSRLCLQATEAAEEDVGLLPVETAPAPAAGPAPAAPAAAESSSRLRKRLLVVDGADQGRSFPLPESGTVTLGKDRRHAEITLHDLYVARVHCLLEINGDKVELVSEEGHDTLLNGKKVTRQAIVPGDVVRIGNSFLRLETAAAADEPAPPAAGDQDTAEVMEDEETIELEVEEEGGEEFEVVEEEDEAESLSDNISERARLLHVWRGKLAELSGQTFGHYRLGALLGRGRCGVVFQAEDLKGGQVVALKVLSPQFPQGNQEVQRFAGLMKGLLALRHPNLVGLVGAGKSGAYTWVAREYVEGESLAEVIRLLGKGRVCEEQWACGVAIQVARALDFARKHRLRHGKVTPANILVRKRDQVVKLADLMLGAVLEGSQLWQAAQEHRPAAELCYLAPEQAEAGAFVDDTADLYNLGAVTYALLTGRPPFVGDTAEEVLEQVRGPTRVARPAAFNPDIPPRLEKVVLKMLAKRQEDRYQTPAELLADLEPIAAEQAAEA